MTYSRYFPKISTFSPSLQYKGDILKHKRGISTYFGKTTVLWRKHFEKRYNSGNIFIHDFAKCNANVSLKSSLTCTTKNLKRNVFYHFKSSKWRVSMGMGTFDKSMSMQYLSVTFWGGTVDIRGGQKPEKGSLESCYWSKDLRTMMVWILNTWEKNFPGWGKGQTQKLSWYVLGKGGILEWKKG